MIKDFIEAWDKNKYKAEEFIKTHEQSEYCNSYKDLVKLLFDIVINPAFDNDCEKYDTENIMVIDDGDYQGTQVFILHEKTYQPNVKNYIYTHVYYGSCSGCDTLMSICYWDEDKIPSKEQVSDYMTLLLHLLQHCVCMSDGGTD